ncbi:unnamed protein product, partial [marine sediment metagenome]
MVIDICGHLFFNYARNESPGPDIGGKFPLFSESGSRSRLRQKLQSYGFSAQGANLTIIGVSLYLSLSAFIISIYQNFYLLITLTAFGWMAFEL